MLTAIFDLAMRISPTARQRIIRFWYQLLSRLDTKDFLLFMNYGYAHLDTTPPLALQAEDEPNRYLIQLYHQVANPIDLRERDVLEVGCGRGGGAAFLARYLGPQSMTGVDLSDQAIRFCAARHGSTGARFVPGNAEHLPFGAQTFDVVINVESSHCYGSTEQFLCEVERVLRPGGYLLYTDFRDHDQLEHWRSQIAAAGFCIQDERSITTNVVRALDLDHDRRQALIERHMPQLIRKRFGSFAGLRGSPIYEDFRTGRLEYRYFVLRKSAEA
jgi:ubiquinone/menaquinone biosynthesis C-methylase UbiE